MRVCFSAGRTCRYPGHLRMSWVVRFFSTRTLQVPAGEKCWQVSSYGRCCNLAGVVSQGSAQPSGYRTAHIAGYMFYLHRLVAFAFLGPPPTGLAWQVNHLDGNPSNNRLENLEYVTASQNILHASAKLSRPPGKPQYSKPVMWRVAGSQRWTSSPSMKDAAKQLGMNRKTVSSACRQGKPAKGFEFQLAESTESTTLVGEQWRQMYDPMSGALVPGRMVSSLGRIRSKNGTRSSGWQTKAGYYRTKLTLSLYKRCEFVHRLVAFAFLGPPVNPRNQVNHKDLDKGNNALDNLEYVTPAENIAHYYRANASSRRRPDGKPVESRRINSKDDWKRHSSVAIAAEVLGVHTTSISKCLHGRRCQTGGFEFQAARTQWATFYAEEEWRKVDLEAHFRERAGREKGKQAAPLA